MTGARQAVGRWGETAAADYLRGHGYTVFAQNVRTPYGELDLIACHPAVAAVVFVEVKTRRSSSLGPPEIAVTVKKQAHLRAAAQAYLLAHPELPADGRIDVIAVTLSSDGCVPEIVHFENAVTGG